MPRRNEYPLDIELLVPNEPSSFATDSQYHAAQIMLEHWNGQFKALTKIEDAEHGSWSRGMFQTVYNDYFGPEGSDETFGEIYHKFETLEDWREHKRLEGVRDAASAAGYEGLTDRELEIFKSGTKFGFELAKNL